MGNEQQTNPAEEDYNHLSELSQRLGLDEKESDQFIKSSMTRLGYKPRVSWDPPENENDNGNEEGGDFFSGKRKEREQRQVRGGQQPQQPQQRASGGSGWQYDN